ncbi:MAG: YHYH domain-containing protein [Clostridia bacterium]|nr:YHYH domain-containing protein [Clostridia bacterium]
MIILLSPISMAHSGRTDANGGHYDRSTGIYHYHNGGSNYENELIAEDDDDSNSNSSFYEYRINKLNSTIETKQETIDELNAEIEELNKKLEDDELWTFIYILVITGLSIYIYYIKKK